MSTAKRKPATDEDAVEILIDNVVLVEEHDTALATLEGSVFNRIHQYEPNTPREFPTSDGSAETRALNAARKRFRTVRCAQCGLGAPADTTLWVHRDTTNENAFLCSIDCLARWACDQADLKLHRPDDAGDPYFSIISQLHNNPLTRQELRGIIAACRHQLSVLT